MQTGMAQQPWQGQDLQVQIDRLLNCDLLRTSEALCRILAFLAARPGVRVEQRLIATEVLGRRANFDPKSDACVRVQMARLRSKLVRYYAGPGVDDPMVVRIPRGTYALSVESRQPRQTTDPMPEPRRAGNWLRNLRALFLTAGH